MSRFRHYQLVAAFIACCGMVLPWSPAVAEDTYPGVANQYVDYALDANGALRGTVVDANGQALADYPVALANNNELVVSTTSDAEGHFALPAASGGTYLLATNDQALPCRVWSNRAAPPSASREALLVVGNVDRGQQPMCSLGRALLSDPVILGLVVAGAIAIPIIVHNSGNDSSSASGP